MKKIVKRSAIVIGSLGLAYILLIGIGGGLYWHSMSNVEKCVMLTKIQILHQSTLSAQFYEDEPFVVKTCEVLNPSSIVRPTLVKGGNNP